MAPVEIALAAFERAPQPKRLHSVDCTHFEAYDGDYFQSASTVMRDFLLDELSTPLSTVSSRLLSISDSQTNQSLSAAARLRTTLVPSSIREARASRRIFSIGYSRLRPFPPCNCSAESATSSFGTETVL